MESDGHYKFVKDKDNDDTFDLLVEQDGSYVNADDCGEFAESTLSVWTFNDIMNTTPSGQAKCIISEKGVVQIQLVSGTCKPTDPNNIEVTGLEFSDGGVEAIPHSKGDYSCTYSSKTDHWPLKYKCEGTTCKIQPDGTGDFKSYAECAPTCPPPEEKDCFTPYPSSTPIECSKCEMNIGGSSNCVTCNIDLAQSRYACVPASGIPWNGPPPSPYTNGCTKGIPGFCTKKP